MPLPRRTAAVAVAALLLAGCRIDAGAETAPDGYHRMSDGSLMANVAMGDHGGHDHAVPSQADFPAGVVPVGLQLPRLAVVAPVVATSMDSGAIQGPPVAGDVAWLEQTRRPGEIGPAILGGVATLDGQPGAFADLDQLAPGDEFLVVGDDQQLLTYVVDSAGWSPVADRPTLFSMGEGRSEVRLVAWAVGSDAPPQGDYVVRAYLTTADTAADADPATAANQPTA